MDEFAMPRLAKGAHGRGSGAACAMNAVSYLAGDEIITDHPESVDAWLRAMAIMVNDSICREMTHVVTANGTNYLCDECSHLMWLAIARLIGTGSVAAIGLDHLGMSIDLLRMFLTEFNTNAMSADDMLSILAHRFLGSDNSQITSRFEPCCDMIVGYRTSVIRDALIRVEQIVALGYINYQPGPVDGQLTRRPVQALDVSNVLNRAIQRCIMADCAHNNRQISIGYLNAAIDLFERHTNTQRNTVFTRADRQLIVDEGKLVNA